MSSLKFFTLFLLVSVILTGAGCQQTSSQDESESEEQTEETEQLLEEVVPTTTSIVGSGDWVGGWRLVTETISNPMGSLVSPLTNKLLYIDDSFALMEDYSVLEGFGRIVDCETSGATFLNLRFETDDHTAVIYWVEGMEIEEFNISCADETIQTNAVPRTFHERYWTLSLNETGTTITASSQYGPSQVVQVYRRISP